MELEIIIFRIFVTFILALLFGLERQKSHKPIGFGTFIFVAIGSCGLAIAAIELSLENPLPLLGSIVTGIGFLGAGALIRTTDKIFGFTTAASIWVFAIFGLLIGIGDYASGAVIYSLVWMVILIDMFLEKRGIGSYQKKLILKTKIGSGKEIEKILREFIKIKMISIELDKENNSESYCYLVECSGKKLRKTIYTLNNLKWIIDYKIE